MFLTHYFILYVSSFDHSLVSFRVFQQRRNSREISNKASLYWSNRRKHNIKYSSVFSFILLYKSDIDIYIIEWSFSFSYDSIYSFLSISFSSPHTLPPPTYVNISIIYYLHYKKVKNGREIRDRSLPWKYYASHINHSMTNSFIIADLPFTETILLCNRVL